MIRHDALWPGRLLLMVATIAAAGIPTTDAAGQTQKQAAGTDRTTRNSRAGVIAARGKLGQELWLAAAQGNLDGVKALLKQGADPEARNSLDMTPLIVVSAMGNTAMMDALIGAGAKLDTRTPYGSALYFACLTGASSAIDLLLAKGAKMDVARPDGITPLMLVSRLGLTDVARELLRRKVDVNAADITGATALTFAAREGQTEVGRVLLAAGAKVDAADSLRWTPLTYAAVGGYAEFVRLLLDKGANPNVRDAKGRTPLVLAAAYGDHPDVIRALMDGGADPKASDARSRTAYALATARGHEQCAKLLDVAPSAGTAGTTGLPRTVTASLQLSTRAIGHSMAEFNKSTGCVSCHHEGLGWTTAGIAAEHGFAFPPAVERAYFERVTSDIDGLLPAHKKALADPRAMKDIPLIEMGDIPIYYGYVLAGMAAHRRPPTEATGAMATVLARLQMPDGHWMFGLPRVPMESSNFTMTALAIQALRTYGPKANAKEMGERIGKAKAWLLATPTQSSEDRAFRLIGLRLAGASPEELQKPLEELRAEQRPDGGWPQLPNLQSDAYATGQALYALHRGGGMPVSDQVYQSGVRFLLRTQGEDGSWFISKRAVPANNYFDAGFPHGVSQFASFNGSCWATIALAQTVDRAQQSARAR